MGREIKRVPSDFDWPLNKIWPGYMRSICTEEVRYACHLPEETDCESVCKWCRRFAQLAGLPTESHGCPNTRIEPPSGDGWQLWETVSEGSPISPVFATAEELADWLVQPGNDTTVTVGTTRQQWLEFILGAGYAPSMVWSEGNLRPGVQGF